MYIFIINTLCLYLAFFSHSKVTKRGFKLFSASLLFEFFAFDLLVNGINFELFSLKYVSSFTTISWTFVEFYSIASLECFLLALLILKAYGANRSFLFFTYNFILSFIYLMNIYTVLFLNDKTLWRIIYKNQWAIGVISVILLIDHRLVYERLKHFINFSHTKLAIYWANLALACFKKKGNK